MSRALVIDDDIISRTICRYLLKQQGFMIDLAENSDEGIRYAEHSHYDIILVDVGLPDRCGLSTAKILKSMPNTQHSHIVAITAHMADLTDEPNAQYINTMQPKPMTADSLNQILEHIN